MFKVGDWVRVKATALGYSGGTYGKPLQVVRVYNTVGLMSVIYMLDTVLQKCFYESDLESAEPTPKLVVTKGDVLDRAKALVTGDREDDYGNAFENLSNIAKMWSVIFGCDVQPFQVALGMDAVKTCRLIKTPSHADSWYDKGGYAGLGGEVALND